MSTSSRVPANDTFLRPRWATAPTAFALMLAAAGLTGCSSDNAATDPGNDPGPDAAAAEASEASAPDAGDAGVPDVPDAAHDDATPDAPVEPDATGGDSGGCTDDTSCDDGEFCDQGGCSPCLPEEIPECDNGLISDQPYGNGCILKVCCENGFEYDPATGACVGFPLLEIGTCPWTRVFECYIKLMSDGAGVTVTTPDDYGPGSLVLKNGGGATVHISMGLTPETSSDFSIVTSPLPTEIAPFDSVLIQFQYTPQTDERDEGEFVVKSDAVNGTELRLPLIGDTWLTPCTSSTVKDTCIPGQYCDPWADPQTCAECFQPQDPVCTGGQTVAVEPEGSYKCVSFFCQCPPGSVYLQSAHGCAPAKPCDATCTNCQPTCMKFPATECGPDDMVDHCLD